MLRTRILSLVLVIGGVSIIFSSCESNRWFQSEDKLKSKIQTTWSMVRIPSTRPAEEWTFKEGKVQRIVFNTTQTDSVLGNYSISTTYTKAFLSITDFNPDNEQLNANWEIIELDNGLLYIATDHDGASGVKQKEFSEK